MQEWRMRQEIYHRLNKDHDDDLNKIDFIYDEHFVEYNVLRHFEERIDDWLYPAKSYFVAFCYAYWISVDFNENFWELLRDPNLLAGNDPFFKPYDEDPSIYNMLFDTIQFPIPMTGMVPDVRKYYEKEFHDIWIRY